MRNLFLSETPQLAMPPQVIRSWSQGSGWGKLKLSPLICCKAQIIWPPFLESLRLYQDAELIVHGPQATVKCPVHVA